MDKAEIIAEDIYTGGISVTERFISDVECGELLAVFLEKEKDMKQAGIGRNEKFSLAESIRGDKILWLERNENAVQDKVFFSKLEELAIALNRRCFLGLNGHEFHFAKYEPGTFYKKHKDVFSNDDARKISVVLYLNQSWQPGDGGELVIYAENKIRVAPRAGTLVVFESHIEHEVLPGKKERRSVTGWLKRSDRLI